VVGADCCVEGVLGVLDVVLVVQAERRTLQITIVRVSDNCFIRYGSIFLRMTNWIVIAIVGGLASNLSNFLVRVLLKDGDDATAYAWFNEVFRLIFFSIVSIFTFRLVFDTRGFLLLLGLGIAELFGIYAVVKMHAYSDLSISTIVSRTRLIWIPIIAFIVYRELLTPIEYLGMAILFVGLVTVSSPKKIIVDKGIKYAYVGAVFVAIVNVMLKMVAPYASTSMIMVVLSLPSVFLFPILMKDSRHRIKVSLTTKMPLKIFIGLVTAVATYMLASAISMGPVSIVTALYQSMMVTSVIAGIVVLKEREDIGKKIVGCLIALVGVLLLTG